MAALTYTTRDAVKTRLKITDAADDGVLDTIVGQVNAYVERVIGCPAGPSLAVSLTLDGRDARGAGRMMFVRQGVRSLSLVEVASETGAAFESVVLSDVILRPLAHERVTDMEAQQVWLVDVPTGNWSTWPPGYANVRLTGAFGPAAIFPDIKEVADVIAVRAFRAKQSGQRDLVGADDKSQALVSRYLALRDRMTLRAYRDLFRSTAG